MAYAKEEELADWTSEVPPGHFVPGQDLGYISRTSSLRWATTVLSGSQWPTRRKWHRSTADLLCSWLTYSSHLRKGSMRVNSYYQEGASRADLFPSWPLEDMLSPWFLRILQPLFPGDSEENSHCGRFREVCTLRSSTSFPSPSPLFMPCLLS